MTCNKHFVFIDDAGAEEQVSLNVATVRLLRYRPTGATLRLYTCAECKELCEARFSKFVY